MSGMLSVVLTAPVQSFNETLGEVSRSMKRHGERTSCDGMLTAGQSR